VNETQQTQETRGPEAQVHCLCMGMGPKVTGLLQCGSESAWQHLRNARVEFLKAIRTLIDERIDYLTKTQKKGTTVAVE
jgi:hypothetical protein